MEKLPLEDSALVRECPSMVGPVAGDLMRFRSVKTANASADELWGALFRWIDTLEERVIVTMAAYGTGDDGFLDIMPRGTIADSCRTYESYEVVGAMPQLVSHGDVPPSEITTRGEFLFVDRTCWISDFSRLTYDVALKEVQFVDWFALEGAPSKALDLARAAVRFFQDQQAAWGRSSATCTMMMRTEIALPTCRAHAAHRQVPLHAALSPAGELAMSH